MATKIPNPQHNNTKNNGDADDKDNYSYDWRHYLKLYPLCKAVPPWCFQHVPFAKEWEFIGVKGYKIEVPLKSDELPDYCDVNDENSVFWIANAIKFSGYMCKIVWDGAEHIPKAQREQYQGRWINFVKEAKRVGFTSQHGYSIMPPKSMETEKLDNFDWRDYIFNKLVQKHSIPSIVASTGELVVKSQYVLSVGCLVEVLDKNCISRMSVAEVIGYIGDSGRVQLRYWDSKAELGQPDYVCHDKSCYPAGWSKTVGHTISHPPGYQNPVLSDSTILELLECENIPKISISEGMKLEAVDPLNLSIISSATVVKVLSHGYIMILIDGQHTLASGNRKLGEFCYHITSPLIFPCGYCEKRGIELMLPKDYKGDSAKFAWDKYLESSKSEALPIRGLRRDDTTSHGFKVGMKCEAVDIMEPNLICVATITRVVGRLLKISFDGWGNEYDQWMDCKSRELFPVGWCEVFSYVLQYPPGLSPNSDNGHPISGISHKNGD